MFQLPRIFCCSAVLGLVFCSGVLRAQSFDKLNLQKDIAPLLEKYCYECHGPKEQKGGFDFSKYKTIEEVQEDRLSWELLIEQLAGSSMPPKKARASPALKIARVWRDGLNMPSTPWTVKN